MGERSAWRIGLWSAMLLHFAFFLTIGMSRHWGYMSCDLGVFDQAVWNTLHGNFLHYTFTIPSFATSMIRLGMHFDPILLLFVPLYALTPSVEWFTIAQASALALAAWPLFLLACHIFQSEKSGLIWALVYLMNPFLLSAGSWDFHPITLAVPFIALGLLAVVKRNSTMLILSCLLILTCKEHMGLAVAGFGVLWWFRYRDSKTPMLLIALGISHLLLVFYIIMPYFSPIDTPLMLGEQLGSLSRYSWLGTSLTEVLHTLVTQPVFVWERIVEMGGLAYWGLLVTPYLFIFPFLGLPFLLPGLADLAANSLSMNPMPKGIWAYHSAGLIPLFTVAAIFGVERMSRWQRNISAPRLAGLILTVSLVAGYVSLPLPIMGAANFWAPNKILNWPDSGAQTVRSAVGSNASLSVQGNVGAHFSQRQSLYLYPDKVGEVDAIILHLASPTTNIDNFPEHLASINWLDGHLRMDRREYLASIECLLANGEYGILLWDNPWLVLSKNTANSQPEDVPRKVKQLRSEWNVEAAEYQNILEKQKLNYQSHSSCFH